MSVYCFAVHWIPLWSLSYFIHTWTLGSTYYFHFTDEEENWSSGNENILFKIILLVVRGLGHKTRSFQPQSYILLLHCIVVQPLTCLPSLFSCCSSGAILTRSVTFMWNCLPILGTPFSFLNCCLRVFIQESPLVLCLPAKHLLIFITQVKLYLLCQTFL